MKPALALGVPLLHERPSARRRRLAGIQRFSGFSFRNSSRGARPLASNWSLSGTAGASSAPASRPLRKSRWRTTRTILSGRCRRSHTLWSAGAVLSGSAVPGTHGKSLALGRSTGWSRRTRRCRLRTGSSGAQDCRLSGLGARNWRPGWQTGRSRGRASSGCNPRSNGRGSSWRCGSRSSCCRCSRRSGPQRRGRWLQRCRGRGRSGRRLSRRRCSNSRFRGSYGRARRLALRCNFCGLGCRVRGGEIVEMFPRQFGVLDIERARVRFLILDADLRQVVDQHLGLDLEFPCQLIDTNLIGF
jgi:hypothetical protein